MGRMGCNTIYSYMHIDLRGWKMSTGILKQAAIFQIQKEKLQPDTIRFVNERVKIDTEELSGASTLN